MRRRQSMPAQCVLGDACCACMHARLVVVAGQVMGSSTPRRREDVAALALCPALRVRLVVTLTEETPLPADWFTGE